MVNIGGIQKLSLIDYPDKLSCVVFLFGCNFRCPYCHNPELVIGNFSPKVEEKDFFSFLEKRKNYLEGVVITGGEPTINKDLPEFIQKIRSKGFLIGLETNGSNPEMLEKLLKNGMINYIGMDIKAPLEKYPMVVKTKLNIEKIKRSIELIKNSGLDYDFRTTVVPKLLSKEDLLKIGEELKGAKKYFLQQFRPLKTLDPSYKKEISYTENELKEFKELLKPNFEFIGVRA